MSIWATFDRSICCNPKSGERTVLIEIDKDGVGNVLPIFEFVIRFSIGLC